MMPAMTEEEIIEFGKSIGKSVLRRASIQERMEGLSAKDLLEGIPPQVLLEYLSRLSEDVKQMIRRDLGTDV